MTAANFVRERIALAPRVGQVPVIVVPSRIQRVTFSGRCPECRGSAFVLDAPATGVYRAHVAERSPVLCLLCGRTVAVLVIGDVRQAALAGEAGR